MDAETLFLFVDDFETAQFAQESGVNWFVVDWEKRTPHLGKDATFQWPSIAEITLATRVSELGVPLCVRVNALSKHSEHEVNEAVACGAKMVMVPMSADVREVNAFAELISGRAKLFVQIETASLANHADSLLSVNWECAHIGLNDLAVSLGNQSIWDAVEDKTVEQIISGIPGRQAGFAGVTIPSAQHPIPPRLLISEMVRLKCEIFILRNTFLGDVSKGSFFKSIQEIRQTIMEFRDMPESLLAENADALCRAILGVRP